MTRWLIALLLILGATPSAAQEPRVIQLQLTEAQWRELLELGGPVPVPPPEPRSLAIPTALYLSAVAAEWTTAAPACALQCNAWTRTLPGVNDVKVAAPLGLSINAAVLVLAHYWIAPRWPRVADGLLFSLGTFHAASAVEHASSARRTLKSGAP